MPEARNATILSHWLTETLDTDLQDLKTSYTPNQKFLI